jgi:hypothetical protein
MQNPNLFKFTHHPKWGDVFNKQLLFCSHHGVTIFELQTSTWNCLTSNIPYLSYFFIELSNFGKVGIAK